jgi:hypothetical protein
MNKKRNLILTYSKDLIKKKNNFLLKYKKFKSDLEKRNVHLIIKKIIRDLNFLIFHYMVMILN